MKNKARYRITEAIILVASAIFMLALADKESFWVDELYWTIGVIDGKSVGEILARLLGDGYNLPLYYLILKPFYDFLPYGEIWILLPSIAFAVCGSAVMGKLGREIGGEKLGIATLFISASSASLLCSSWELRPYTLFFFLSALAFLCYLHRLKKPSIKNNVIYGISIFLILYCHWFGVLVIAFFGLTDIVLCIQKKVKLRYAIPYLISIGLFVPWFMLMLKNHTVSLVTYWAPVPNISELFRTVRTLFGESHILTIIFFIGVCFAIITSRKTVSDNFPIRLPIYCIYCILWTFGTIIIYSAFINPKGSLFVARYFYAVLPQMIILTAYAVVNLPLFIPRLQTALSCVLVLTLLTAGVSGYVRAEPISEPYREVSTVIASDSRAYDNNSAVVSVNEGEVWVKYYFIKRGFAVPNCFMRGQSDVLKMYVENGEFSQYRTVDAETLYKYDVLFVFEDHSPFSEKVTDMIMSAYAIEKIYAEYSLTIYTKQHRRD